MKKGQSVFYAIPGGKIRARLVTQHRDGTASKDNDHGHIGSWYNLPDLTMNDQASVQEIMHGYLDRISL